MATKTLIRTGASLLNRLVASKPNPFLVHQNNPTHHHQFPSPSKIQTSLYLPSHNDAVSATRVASHGFLYPSGLPSLEFFLPDGNSSDEPMLLFPKRTFQPSTIRRKRNHGFFARSPRLTPAVKEPKNEVVVKKQIARKLVLKKNTRAAAQTRKQDKSPYMQMFFMLVKSCFPNLIKIDYDIPIFGITWKSYLDKAICEEIMDFKEVSNCAINIWIKHLYDEMDKTETAKPVQFGNFEMIRPSKVALKEGPQYISKLLGMIELGQIILIPYNPSFHWVLLAIDIVRRTIYYLDPKGNNPTDELMQIVNQGIRVYQSLHSNNKSGSVTWVSVKCPMQPGSFECGYYVMKYMQQIVTNVNILKDNFKGINEYTLEDITQLRDDWAIYVAHIITQYNEENTNDKDNIAIVR